MTPPSHRSSNGINQSHTVPSKYFCYYCPKENHKIYLSYQGIQMLEFNYKLNVEIIYPVLPLGYKIEIPEKGLEQKIGFSDYSEPIRKAFLWKAQMNLSTVEIAAKLAAMGFPITEKRLSELFRNPFYCGKIANALLDGEVIEGKHPKLISEEMFLKTNQVLEKNPQNYHWNDQNEQLPLRKNIICASCGTTMTGYLAKKKGKYYYKCNSKGCKNNRSALELHKKYETLLETYTLNPKFIGLFKKQLLHTYEFLNKNNQENISTVKKRSTEVKKKIEQLEEKFILGDIDRSLYDKFNMKYRTELSQIEKEIENSGETLSNSEKFINNSVEICSRINKIWCSGDYAQKVKLQKTMFPEGVMYDREKDEYRTSKVNSVIELISKQARVLESHKKREDDFFVNLPLVVAPGRIEPPTEV